MIKKENEIVFQEILENQKVILQTLKKYYEGKKEERFFK